MNRRFLLALGIVFVMAGWLVSTAAAHHSEITASIDCNGGVTFTAEAWKDHNASTAARTNAQVKVWASTNGGATYTEIATGRFGADNGFKFSGTYAAGSASSVKLKVQEIANWGNGTPPSGPRYFTATKSNNCPPPPVCPAANSTVTSSSAISITGGMAKVTFQVAAGCKDIELTLVSYKAPSATYDEATADKQVLFEYKTQLFSAGSWELQVGVPNCFYQVDFVYGKHIVKLGPAGSNNFYSKQGRLIRAANGGTGSCDSTPPPPPPTPTPVPNPVPVPEIVVIAAVVVPPPAVALVKTERVGAAGAFVRGPLKASVGQRIFYRMTATNTGTVPVSIALRDDRCDRGTLAPTAAPIVAPGASVTFTCSHRVTKADGKRVVNTAVATATATDGRQARATSTVVANIVVTRILGTQKTVKKPVKAKPKKVTTPAKPAKAVPAQASFTG